MSVIIIRHVIILPEVVQSFTMSALYIQDQTKEKERKKKKGVICTCQSVVKIIAIV